MGGTVARRAAGLSCSTATACTPEVRMPRSNDPEFVAIDVTSKMGVLDEATCVQLLGSTPIGRIGFATDDGLLVLPVNFKWYENSVVFRTLEGQKLAAAAEHRHVCFEVDQWDAATRTGWSVVVQGVAREVTNWAEDANLDQIGLVPWAKDEWRPIWVRIEPTMVSGRVLR
jgi:nitroimidazol reductase NimA-like FMN-containing flavoprotein (pyridoxamine 5'-phosphate oxidase superfamily)